MLCCVLVSSYTAYNVLHCVYTAIQCSLVHYCVVIVCQQLPITIYESVIDLVDKEVSFSVFY